MRSTFSLVLLATSSFALPAWQARLHNPPASIRVTELSLDDWSSVHKAVSYKTWQFFESFWPLEKQVDTEDQSILAVIKNDPQFTRLSKLLDLDEKTSAALSDESAGLTFFAPNDDALRKPDDSILSKRKSSCGKKNHDMSLAHLSELLNDMETSTHHDDKKKRRERFKKILHKVLQYHILPGVLDNNLLSENGTVATTMTAPEGAFDGQPQRIRTEWTLVPPGLQLNFDTRVVKSDVRAKNGFVHIVDSPLMPQPSILDQLFLYPEDFSTITSLLQKVEIDSEIQFRYSGKEGNVKGDGPAVTFFVPNNEAFDDLPEDLRLYLFSTRGEGALRKLLKFHIVPDHIVHVDWHYDATSSSLSAPDDQIESKIFVPSLLKDHDLEITIVKPTIPLPGRLKRKMVVNGEDVVEQDATALNGAAHVIGALLDPRGAQPQPDPDVKVSRWENWQDWLPAWAERV